MQRRDFKIIRQIRAGGAQRRAAPQWSGLTPLAAKPPEIEVVLVRYLLVQSHDAIIAISRFRARTEEVVRRGWQTADNAPGPKTVCTDRDRRSSTLRNAVCLEHR